MIISAYNLVRLPQANLTTPLLSSHYILCVLVSTLKALLFLQFSVLIVT